MATVYRAQTNPGNTPMLSGASAEAFGAAAGRGLQEAGATLDRVQEREKQRARETQAAQAGVDFAKMTGEIDVASQASRETAPAAAAGHTKAQIEEADKRINAFLGTLTDEKVRNVYTERAAELRARVLSREDAFERGKRVEHFVEQVDEIGSQHANNMATNPEATRDGGASLVAALSDVEAGIKPLDMAEDVKGKLTREQQRKVAVAWGNRMVTDDHKGLIAVIETGTLNPYLEPEDIASLRSGALVEGRRAEAADRARKSAEEAQAREQLSLFQKRIAAGDQPSDAEFAAHAAIAKTYGLEGHAFDLTTAQSEVHINRETRDWTPVQFDQEIATLQGKGDKRSTGENVRLQQLERIRGSRVSEFNSNPAAAAARAGNPAPPVDWENPSQDQIEARGAWARGYARAAGLATVPYMSPEELRPLRERAEQGAAGQLEVAQQLRRQWGAGAGGEIARQVDDDKALQLMVGMNSSSANWYGRGVSARQRNPKLFDREAALEVFAREAEAIPQDLRTPVFDAAANIAAAITDKAGNAEFNETTFKTAISFAMGATGAQGSLRGGVGEWKERSIWLPPELTQADLERRISRANVKQWVAASVGAAGTPNGKAPRYMTAQGKIGGGLTAQQIRELELQTVSPGVYRLRGRNGGVLIDSDGAPWQFDVRRLP